MSIARSSKQVSLLSHPQQQHSGHAPIQWEKWVNLEPRMCSTQYNHYVDKLTKASAVFQTHDFASNVILNYNFSVKC
jgi:hypothetical protein